MKNKLLATVIAIAGGFTLAHAEPKADAPIAPSKFFGKTIEECEQILGKPTKVETLSGVFRGSRRHYRTTVAGLSAICLEQLPQGSPKGPIDTKVSCVRYCFPEGALKTWKEAFTIIGASMNGADRHSTRRADKLSTPVTESDSPSTVNTIFRLDDGLRASWTPSKGKNGYGISGADSVDFAKDI